MKRAVVSLMEIILIGFSVLLTVHKCVDDFDMITEGLDYSDRMGLRAV